MMSGNVVTKTGSFESNSRMRPEEGSVLSQNQDKKRVEYKSVVLNLFSTGPHYGASASLTGCMHVIYILPHHTNQPTRFIILFIA